MTSLEPREDNPQESQWTSELSPENENSLQTIKTQSNVEKNEPDSVDNQNEENTNRAGDVIKLDEEVALPGCGVGSWHPEFLQRFKTLGYFSAVYGVAGIMTSALAVYIGSQITTLEKHFNLNSSLSGLLMSSNEIGFFVTCLPLSHLARRVHIPRALGICAMIYGVSGLMCIIPYFGTKDDFSVASISIHNQSDATNLPAGQMCARSSHITNDSLTSGGLKNVTSGEATGSGGHQRVSDHWRNLAIVLIGAGMILQGSAKAPRQSYSTVYIDDNVPKTKTSLYLGVVFALGVLGPALAYVVGGVFSSIYITLEETHLSIRDPRWLGAWWLGFLLFGGLSLLSGFPLLCFPRKMVEKPEITKAEKKRQDRREGKNAVIAEITGFVRTIGKLFINPVYVMMVLSTVFSAMSYAGAFAFAPKFLEVYFNQPSWRVNILMGALNVAPASVGFMISGVITYRLKMSPMRCLKTAIGLQIVSVACQAACFLFTCDPTQMLPGTSAMASSGNSSICTNGCQCTLEALSYFPVCGEDGYNYFNPCYAGCTATTDDRSSFTNCTCMSSPEFTIARGGLCSGGCDVKFYIYMFLSFVAIFLLSLAIMPMVVVSLRAISEAQKPMALGISPFFSSLLGSFPSPILYGAVIDSTCLMTHPSYKGACLLYDLQSFRNYYLGTFTGLRSAVVIVLVCVYVYAKKCKKDVFMDYDDEEIIKAKKTACSPG